MKFDTEKMKVEPGTHWTYINPDNEEAMQEILSRYKEWEDSLTGADRQINKVRYQAAFKDDKIPFFLSSWLFGIILRGDIRDDDADRLMTACVEEIEAPTDRHACLAGMQILAGNRRA